MDARLYIRDINSNPASGQRFAANCAKRIESKDLALVDLVESLGEYLSNEDITLRAKAIAFFTAVLECLDSKSLSRQQVSVITLFLCDRLEDEAGLKETSTGLIALEKMKGFTKEDATMVASLLFKVDLPKHPQSTRFVVFKLLDGLISRQRDALKAMGDDFVTGLADLVGGEKDPRNLMIILSISKVVLVEFDIVKHIELLYDLVFCYFPITFRPPPDDPYGITAQDLKLRLRECIAATRYFAGRVFPELIEKLDSTSQSVKKDVLQTIAACARSYGLSVMSTHSSQLWDAMKYEILNSAGEDELADEALIAVKAIAATLSFGLNAVPPVGTPLARYVRTIIKECIKLLQEPQQKQAKPAGQILAAVATASPAAYSCIIQSTMPELLTVYSDAEGISKRRALMEVFGSIFDSTTSVYGAWSDMSAPPIIENPSQAFKDRLFEIFSAALMGSSKEETSFRIVALRGLVKLCKIRNFLEDSEIGMVVQYLNEVVLGEEEKQELREEALQGLRDVSRIKPNLIMNITFPVFMAQLPDEEEAGKNYTGTLEALAKLSFERPVFEVLLTRLLNKLDVVLQSGSSPAYPRAILSTLLFVLQNKPETNHEDAVSYFNRLVPSLLTKTILPLVDGSTETNRARAMADDTVLDVTGRLVNIIFRTLSIDQQKVQIDQFFDLFVKGSPSVLIKENSTVVAEKFRPFDKNAAKEQAGTLVIFVCALAGTRREIVLPIGDLSEFLRQSVELAQNPKSLAHRMAILRLIALIVNKWMKEATDVDFLQKMAGEMYHDISSNSLRDTVIVEERVRTLFWITKALVLRADKYGMELTENLEGLLGMEGYGAMASRGFAVLLGEDELLNKDNYAVVRLLSKQRVFSHCVPRIVSGFKITDSITKPNYLIALSNILRNVPSSVILSELPKIMPLLLQSLDLPEMGVKAATIDTLYITVLESSDAVKEHISSLITRLLAATTGNQPRVRMAALRCLRVFPGAIRNELLLPYKRQILRRLMDVLDDPKRSVRKEAVDCRARWFAMDEPTE